MDFWNRWIKPQLDYVREPHRIALLSAIGGGFLLGLFYHAARFGDPLVQGLVSWAKDWQTLLTGVAASIAAWIAVRPAYRQLAEAQRQSAVLKIPIYKGRINEILEQIRIIERLRILIDTYTEEIESGIFGTDPSKQEALLFQEVSWRAVDGFYANDLMNFAVENPGDNLCPGGIMSIVSSAKELRTLSEDFRRGMSTSQFRTRIDNDASYVRNDQMIRHMHSIAVRLKEKVDTYYSNLNNLYERLWSDVREAEHRAHY